MDTGSKENPQKSIHNYLSMKMSFLQDLFKSFHT